MLTLDEIRKKKIEYGFTNEQLSKLSGVPLSTLQKIISNVTSSPRYETIKAISDVFEGSHKDNRLQAGHADLIYSNPGNTDNLLHEAQPVYGTAHAQNYNSNIHPEYGIPFNIIAANRNTYDRQGTYTLDDYLALPDEQRVELIDGVFYDMSAPATIHQIIGGEVYRVAANYIKSHNGKCVPFMAPVDVQLDCDNHTIVQPDMMIVCDRSKITPSRIFGAPDFVLEVLSPSTKKKDVFIKSMKYCNAKVKEYWMADPENETIITYDFRDAENFRTAIYTFEQEVPVLLYGGKLKINFRDIKEYISFMM